MTITYDPSRKIHEQITEDNWCQGNYFASENGNRLFSSNGKLACRACMIGWLYLSIGRNPVDGIPIIIATNSDKIRQTPQFKRISKEINFNSVSTVNDYSKITFKQVQRMFKEADV